MMAAKKKRRPSASTEGSGPPARRPTGNAARRERKDEARRARDAEAKQAARRGALRRLAVFAVAGALGFAAISLMNRASAPEPLSAEAKAAATDAGCDPDVRTPAAEAPGNLHLDPGQDPGYTASPATSGFHASTPLATDGRVLTAPVDETQAVHTLEHGAVIIYYRPPGDGGVDQAVLDRLGPIAQDRPATYLIPYPTLPKDVALAFTAWNKILSCPGSVDADAAAAIAQGFVDSFACTSNAPEGKLGDGC
jgi:hypothetical protein